MAQMLGWFRVATAQGLAQEALVGDFGAGTWSARGRRAAGRVRDQKAVRDDLESDLTFQPRIERAIDLTHTAGAYLLYHSVGSKDSARLDHSSP